MQPRHATPALCLLACLGLVLDASPGGAAKPQPVPLRPPDPFTQARNRLNQPDLRRDFPYLNNDFQVLAVGGNYNCIAHTLGLTDRWINPPTGPANARLGPLDQLYGAHGFTRLAGPDLRPIRGVQKVVVYALTDRNGIREVTHAALQLPDGTFASKLGPLALIRHRTLQALAGPTYGVPVAVYAR